MNYKIVSDSSSNLFSLKDVAFAYAPLKIVTENEEFVDLPTLNIAQMVAKLNATKGRSGTSCPNVSDWLEAFGEADAIFVVTITGNLSGSYGSAMLAAEEYQLTHPQAQVCVIDSLSTGPEMALLLERLRDLILQELPFETIRQDILEYHKHTHLLFCLQSLSNLAKNGRINPAVAKIAGLLGIRVIGVASEIGTLEMLHKPRGEKKAYRLLLDEMKSRGWCGGRVRLAHCMNPQAAEEMRTLLIAEYPNCQITVEPCAALCSFYAEEGGLLIGFEDSGV